MAGAIVKHGADRNEGGAASEHLFEATGDEEDVKGLGEAAGDEAEEDPGGGGVLIVAARPLCRSASS